MPLGPDVARECKINFWLTKTPFMQAWCRQGRRGKARRGSLQPQRQRKRTVHLQAHQQGLLPAQPQQGRQRRSDQPQKLNGLYRMQWAAGGSPVLCPQPLQPQQHQRSQQADHAGLPDQAQDCHLQSDKVAQDPAPEERPWLKVRPSRRKPNFPKPSPKEARMACGSGCSCPIVQLPLPSRSRSPSPARRALMRHACLGGIWPSGQQPINLPSCPHLQGPLYRVSRPCTHLGSQPQIAAPCGHHCRKLQLHNSPQVGGLQPLMQLANPFRSSNSSLRS